MQTEQTIIIKRDGREEPLTLEKYHRVIAWAGKNLDVSTSLIELLAAKQLTHRMTTDQLHQIITKACADQISEDTPDYQYMSAKMAIFRIRKIAYGKYEPPTLFNHITRLTVLGKYDKHILEDYSKFEIDVLDKVIDHNRDDLFAYAGVKQLEGKYLIQNRAGDGKLFESPQMLYMLISMCLFSKYPPNTRLKYVLGFYNAISLFKISLPTPIMAGVRTPTRQFSSCVCIETDDSLKSINATASSIVEYASKRAGIGINAGAIRALGSAIRGGEAFHTGCIPFYKYFQGALKSCCLKPDMIVEVLDE